MALFRREWPGVPRLLLPLSTFAVAAGRGLESLLSPAGSCSPLLSAHRSLTQLHSTAATLLQSLTPSTVSAGLVMYGRSRLHCSGLSRAESSASREDMNVGFTSAD